MALFLLSLPAALAASKDLGQGFSDHGVATPLSNHRGMVATADGAGRDVMLVWLYDHRGGYALLMIDAATGRSQQFATPYPWAGDGPFASLLSSGNKYYTHFGSHFSEFDPVKRAFTFFQKAAPQMAMSMTEADDGTIWSATYPNSGLVSFNPKTRDFKDHGSLNRENWLQYPRSIAVDDAGWVHVGIGSTAGQIVVFDPSTPKARTVFAPDERGQGYATVYRDIDGKVYGQAAGHPTDGWIELHRGGVRKIGRHEKPRRKTIVAAGQELFHKEFPSGKRARICDTIERRLVVEDPKTNTTQTVTFDYSSEGAHLMGVAAAPDHTLCGGTAFPMRFFSFNPKTDQWVNRAAYGQFNTVVRQGDHFFFGGYGHGFLLDWDPSRPWIDSEKGRPDSNPRHLTECAPTINRPHDLLAHPDGKTLVLAGTPGYGYTGGGLLFWDRETKTRTLLQHTDIIPDHSTMSLVALPGGRLLGGSTTAPGTGGEKKAKEAELYIMDMATKRVEWHAVVFAGVQVYTDLCLGPAGLVLGFADRTRFFVFDPAKRKIIHEDQTGARFGPCVSQQGPRAFVRGRGDAIYVLFAKGIARLDPVTHQITMLATSPVPISSGGDYLDGRIYFGSGSHVYSFAVGE
ncbi:MAG: hypothetical protein HY736_23545 [Verrucomicrobia bacterium]|nr:hypothetical protein [Verrucomicrobiota bacterium]